MYIHVCYDCEIFRNTFFITGTNLFPTSLGKHSTTCHNYSNSISTPQRFRDFKNAKQSCRDLYAAMGEREEKAAAYVEIVSKNKLRKRKRQC